MPKLVTRKPVKILTSVISAVTWWLIFIVCLCVYAARLFHQAFISFRKYVLEMKSLAADLHIILSDICCGAGLSFFNIQQCM